MKYNININQKAVIDNGWDLKIEHLVILDSVVAMIDSHKFKTKVDGDNLWYWIKVSKILEELPLLQIKERRLRTLISELCDCNLLEKNPDNKKMRTHYIKLGSNYSKYLFSGSNEDESTMQNNTKHLAENCQHTMQNIANYNNTNNNTNNNIGHYDYKNECQYNGFNYKSNVRIPKGYEDEDLFKLCKAKKDEKLEDNHFITMLTKELYFNNFWNIYPKKVGKKKTKDIFMKMKIEDCKDAYLGSKEYNEYTKGKEDRFIKHPQTYINGRHWEDELKAEKLVLPNNWRYMRLDDEQRKLLSPEDLKSYDKHVLKGEVEGFYFKPAPKIYE